VTNASLAPAARISVQIRLICQSDPLHLGTSPGSTKLLGNAASTAKNSGFLSFASRVKFETPSWATSSHHAQVSRDKLLQPEARSARYAEIDGSAKTSPLFARPIRLLAKQNEPLGNAGKGPPEVALAFPSNTRRRTIRIGINSNHCPIGIDSSRVP
jgi:hypothetical protein